MSAAAHQKGFVLDIFNRLPRIEEPDADIWISEAVLNAPFLAVYVDKDGGCMEGIPLPDKDNAKKEILEHDPETSEWELRYFFVTDELVTDPVEWAKAE